MSGKLAPPGTRGVIALSLPTKPLAIGRCDLYLDPATLFVVATSVPTVSGRWSRSLQAANNPALLGLPVVLQAGFGPTAGPLGLDFTNSVLLVHGR